MEVVIKNVRLSFPVLWTAQEYQEGDGKPRWSAGFIVEPGSENDKKIRNAMKSVATDVMKSKAEDFLKNNQNNSQKVCYIEGDSRDTVYEGQEGMMVLTSHRAARTKMGANSRPAIIDRDKSPLLESDGKPYAGCYVNAKVQFYAQSAPNPGVRCSFSVVQFVKDGDAFGAGAPNLEDMEDLGDTGEDEDFDDVLN